MRAWLGIALLAVSWLTGLGYYHHADGWAWGAAVALGTLLIALGGMPSRSVGMSELGGIRLSPLVALAMTLPAAWIAPWPYRTACLLLAFGLATQAVPALRQQWNRFGAGAVLAGCVLLAQAVGLYFYEALTARGHELPAPLVRLLGLLAGLLGINASAYGSTLSVFTMREMQRLSATWELLVDPATLCFAVGALVLLAWQVRRQSPPGKRLRAWLAAAGVLAALLAIWLPVRAVLLTAMFLHDVLHLESLSPSLPWRPFFGAPLDSLRLFWNATIHGLLLLPPALVAWRVFRRADLQSAEGQLKIAPTGRTDSQSVQSGRSETASYSRCALAAALVGLAAAVLTAAAFWNPVGTRKEGRVLVDDWAGPPDPTAAHPDWPAVWEPTNVPYTTAGGYGPNSGYDYYCIFEYLRRYYRAERLTAAITEESLAECDVLILKTLRRAYSPEEIECVGRFVEGGGGLLLIGEHTDVYGTGAHLNAVARQFGFAFRYDCLFGVDTVFFQKYARPLVPHPAVQYLPEFDFAVSCSIDPGRSRGRAAIRSVGLKNLTADYHAKNFYPQAEDRADMQYGAFVQLWSTRRGQGRVLAFTDSTVFSNFCAFEPGKTELMLGMVEWLNRGNRGGDPRWWLAGLGGLLLLGGLAAACRAGILPAGACDAGVPPAEPCRAGILPAGEIGRQDISRRDACSTIWLLLLATGLLGWSVGVIGVRAVHARAMPPQARDDAPPPVRVNFDRTVCAGWEVRSGFTAGKPNEFGLFERWVLRLGAFTARRSGPSVFDGDLAVFVYPDKPLPYDFRDRLVEYVDSGGKVLVVDSPENDKSTANSLLQPFGMSLRRSPSLAGSLTVGSRWPSISVSAAGEVQGGEWFAAIADVPVGATRIVGKGSVTVIGFGSRFSDAQMGITDDTVPEDDLRPVFDLQFGLLRMLLAKPPQ